MIDEGLHPETDVRWRYALWGALMGLLFPVLATVIELLRINMSFSFSNVLDLHSATPLLLIIDTAPLFLGAFAFGIGVANNRAMHTQRRLQKEREKYTKQLEKNNEELSELNEVLDRLIYSTSHDLKTPVINLQSMLHMLRTLRDKPGSEEMIEEVMKRMEDNTEKAQNIISDLMLIGNLEKEKDLKIEKVEMEEVEKSVLEAISEMANNKTATIQFSYEKCPIVWYSKSNLENILLNLLSNSLKYSSPDRLPEIRVQTREEKDFYAILVHDNGIGMDLDKQGHKLFQMFSRLHATAEGSGVGLYMVKKTIEKAAGKIEVSSEVDKGSTFKILIPKKAA